MSQPGMRITVDAAMRARDVSRVHPEGANPEPPSAPAPTAAAAAAEQTKPRKGERRRLGKRAANTKKAESPDQVSGSGGSSPVFS
jgi:hypothetical protein